MILNAGKANSLTKWLQSTVREETSQQFRRTISYLAITLLLAGDVQQNPGPNFSFNGPQAPDAPTRPGTVQSKDNSMSGTKQQYNNRPLSLVWSVAPTCVVCINVTQEHTVISNPRSHKAVMHKHHHFQLFQATNHAKVLWDPHKKSKELFGGDLNLRSVASKTEQIEKLLMDANPDFLCLSESWLTDSSPNTANLMQGYNVFRKD